jgi:short-subunit dehydrogenase
MERWDYRGRWALVTGASAGIGAEFARALAARGMHLVLCARREERLRELAASLAAEHGVETAVVAADLGAEGETERVWREASAGRAIHLLVNNAGFGLKGPFVELALDRQAEMVRLNCIAPMELAHHALREMRGRRAGGIVNVASIAGYQPIPNLAAYAASKAFLAALSEALSVEAADAGVRVLNLSPGPVPTEFQRVAGTAVNARTLGLRTPAQVVAATLRALEAGKASVVPGLANRLATIVVRVAPRSLVLRAAKVVITRFR